jgi:antitoxin HicB
MAKRQIPEKRLPAAFFENDSGKMPVREWLLDLSDDDRKVIGDDIRTAEFGWPDWDADLQVDAWFSGSLGNPKQSKRRQDGPSAVLRSRWSYGASARIHEDHSKDTAKRTRCRGSAAKVIVMKKKPEKGRIGQSFDAFLKEEGRFEESTHQAVKRVLTHQLASEMAKKKLTKSAMAKQLKTSRSQLDRLLDPANTAVTLETLSRAARAVGRRLEVGLR